MSDVIILKGALSNLKEFLTAESRKPFKINEKCFLFHVKSSFSSQDV